ncbi:uncharacterized protein LOC143360657 [Halictus rubicundus]|uniref:uncharacterized protein LOC143359300 n=1 Tax=Halictus rubicundus TaxID=77578 RepID=UPI00403644E3
MRRGWHDPRNRPRLEASPAVYRSSSGKCSGMSLCTGRSICDAAVRTVATRTEESGPGCTRTTRARGHCVGGRISLLMRHRTPALSGVLSLCHLPRGWREFKYSRDQRLQKCCCICWINCQRDNRETGRSSRLGSGIAVRGSPTRK